MKRHSILKLASVFTFVFCLSCGSTEKVITPKGKVYELKGSKFYSNGEEVTATLSGEEKSKINQILEDRLKLEKEAAKRKAELEEAQKKAEAARKKAEKKQKALEKEIKAKEKAREDFFKAQEKLKKKTEKYQKRLDRGDLSQDDIEDWKKRLKDLEDDVKKAEEKLSRS